MRRCLFPDKVQPRYGELRQDQQRQLAAHLLRLDPHSRYLRFGYSLKDEQISRYCRGDPDQDPLIYGVRIDGILRGVAEIRQPSDRSLETAEIALSVESAWQNQGIGTALMSGALLLATAQGLTTLKLHCMPENPYMQRIAAKFGAQFHRSHGLVTGCFDLSDPLHEPPRLPAFAPLPARARSAAFAPLRN